MVFGWESASTSHSPSSKVRKLLVDDHTAEHISFALKTCKAAQQFLQGSSMIYIRKLNVHQLKMTNYSQSF
jgi:hypothetical protein